LRSKNRRSVESVNVNVKKGGIALIFVVALLLVYFWPESEVKQGMRVRTPAVSGRFYPSSPEELKNLIETYCDQAPYLELQDVHGLVCPHAGYIFSGPTAGYSFKQLNNTYDTVILIGPSHYVWFAGASIPEYTHYQTPLGLVKVSEKAESLKKQSVFTTVPEAHTQEHCLEVQLPFLQCILTDFEIVPIVLGDVDPQMVASALSPYIDEKTLVVASSDLSHYHPYEEACNLDKICTEAVPALDFEKAQSCDACGIKAIMTLMLLAEEKGWQGTLLDYRNSGDTAGGKDQVVGYMAVAFYGGQSSLNEEEQQYLLRLARQTLEQYLQDGTLPDVDESELSGILTAKKACFVTLNKHGMLRGCIGVLTPHDNLYKAVMENAVNAAVNDPRFKPVTYEELSEITIEISVLSSPERIFYDDNDLLNQIEGRGVIISAGFNRATYLPQVWEQLPDPEEFISQLCSKAGLPADFWKRGTLEIYVYTAQVFGEDI
jgi:AmmeMemoRadiSam system protein B/AmmeMemoRadiSam system protein A